MHLSSKPSSAPETRPLPVSILRAGERRFCRFVLERSLGRGGMGVVWLARDEMLGEPVALKLLPEVLATDPQALADLRRETRSARLLSHPNIVRVHEFFADDSGAAVAMEYVDGRSLGGVIAERGVLEPSDVMGWLPDLCGALDYAHGGARMVHRDIKPGNVLFNSAGTAKLADFGVSCRIAESATRSTHLLSCGTLAYMSPQQVLGEDPAPADDIYALGVLLYETVAGRPPFQGGDISLQIRRRVPRAPSLLRSREASPLPRVWDEVILACLAKEPCERPSSAGEVAAALASGRFRRRSFLGWRGSLWFALGGLAVAAAVLGLGALGSWVAPRLAAPASESRVAGGELPPLSGPLFVRGSLAQNLVAHLPFDGDVTNCAGERGGGVATGISWTTDRADRPDSSLSFAGRGRVELPLGPGFRLGPTQPFTLTMCVRPDVYSGSMLALVPGGKWRSFVIVVLTEGRIEVQFSDSRKILDVYTPATVPSGAWTHVGVTYNAATLRIYINGDPVAERSWDQNLMPEEGVRLIVGAASAGNFDYSFRGALDDVRVYRSALGEDAMRSIAYETSPSPTEVTGAAAFPWETGRVFAMTQGRYLATDDLDQRVRDEFGSQARVADWNDLAVAWSRWPRLQAELVGWPMNDTLHVNRGGTHEFRPDRYYNATFANGVTHEGNLIHADLGGMTCWLGSWMTVQTRVLAEMPDRAGYDVDTLDPGSVSGHWMHETGGAITRRVSVEDPGALFCLRVPVGSEGSPLAGAEVRLETAAEAAWTVSLGPVNHDSEVSVAIHPPAQTGGARVAVLVHPTANELILVGRRGHLFAALVDSVNGQWLGDLVLDAPTFDPTAIRRLAVTGAVLKATPVTGPRPMQWVLWK